RAHGSSLKTRKRAKFRISLAATLPFLLAMPDLAYGSPEDAGRAFGGCLFIVLLTYLISYISAGRRSVRNWNSFSKWLFWVGIFLAGANIRTLVGVVSEEEQKALGRAITEDIKDITQKFAANLAAQQTEDLSDLYSAPSFATRARMENIITAVQALYAFDQK